MEQKAGAQGQTESDRVLVKVLQSPKDTLHFMMSLVLNKALLNMEPGEDGGSSCENAPSSLLVGKQSKALEVQINPSRKLSDSFLTWMCVCLRLPALTNRHIYNSSVEFEST